MSNINKGFSDTYMKIWYVEDNFGKKKRCYYWREVVE